MKDIPPLWELFPSPDLRAAAAEEFLIKWNKGDVIAQLRAQGIGAIILISMVANGMTFSPIYGGPLLVFVNIRDSLDEWVRTVAHELGHSFQWGVNGGRYERVFWSETKMTECFCDAFMCRWLAMDANRKELTSLLKDLEGGDIRFAEPHNA